MRFLIFIFGAFLAAGWCFVEGADSPRSEEWGGERDLLLDPPDPTFPKILSMQESDVSWPENCGNVGLQNIGNTCYMNSMLQVLFHVNPLVRKLLESREQICEDLGTFHETDDDPRRKLCRAAGAWLLELLHLYKVTGNGLNIGSDTPQKDREAGGNGWLLPLGGLYNCVHRLLSGEFWRSEDAEEFFQRFQDFYRVGENQESKELARVNLGEYLGDLQKLFGYVQKTRVSNLACGHQESSTFTPHYSLRLNVNKEKVRQTLYECLSDFSKPEPMEGRKQYNCGDKNHGDKGLLVNAARQDGLVTLPHILLITLGRFSFDTESLEGQKIRTPVSFPLQLGFVAAEVGDVAYHLIGMVVHGGEHYLAGGHYHAYAKSYGDDPEKGEWWIFDDERRVERVRLDLINQICSSGHDDGPDATYPYSNLPYLLVYQRAGEQSGDLASQSGKGWKPVQAPPPGGPPPPPPPPPPAPHAGSLVELKRKLVVLKRKIEILKSRGGGLAAASGPAASSIPPGSRRASKLAHPYCSWRQARVANLPGSWGVSKSRGRCSGCSRISILVIIKFQSWHGDGRPEQDDLDFGLSQFINGVLFSQGSVESTNYGANQEKWFFQGFVTQVTDSREGLPGEAADIFGVRVARDSGQNIVGGILCRYYFTSPENLTEELEKQVKSQTAEMEKKLKQVQSRKEGEGLCAQMVELYGATLDTGHVQFLIITTGQTGIREQLLATIKRDVSKGEGG